jgi:hypothetical protein
LACSVAAAFADPFAVAFRRQQISLARHREAVGAVGLLANDTDLSVRIEAVDAIGTDIGEIKAAVRRADRPFREHEPFLYQLRLDARRHHTRDSARRLRRNRQDEQPGQRRRADDSARSHRGTFEMPRWLHAFLPMFDAQRFY